VIRKGVKTNVGSVYSAVNEHIRQKVLYNCKIHFQLLLAVCLTVWRREQGIAKFLEEGRA